MKMFEFGEDVNEAPSPLASTLDSGDGGRRSASIDSMLCGSDVVLPQMDDATARLWNSVTLIGGGGGGGIGDVTMEAVVPEEQQHVKYLFSSEILVPTPSRSETEKKSGTSAADQTERLQRRRQLNRNAAKVSRRRKKKHEEKLVTDYSELCEAHALLQEEHDAAAEERDALQLENSFLRSVIDNSDVIGVLLGDIIPRASAIAKTSKRSRSRGSGVCICLRSDGDVSFEMCPACVHRSKPTVRRRTKQPSSHKKKSIRSRRAPLPLNL